MGGFGGGVSGEGGHQGRGLVGLKTATPKWAVCRVGQIQYITLA